MGAPAGVPGMIDSVTASRLLPHQLPMRRHTRILPPAFQLATRTPPPPDSFGLLTMDGRCAQGRWNRPSSNPSHLLGEAGCEVHMIRHMRDVLVVEHADLVRGGVSPHLVVDGGAERRGLDEPRQLVMKPA